MNNKYRLAKCAIIVCIEQENWIKKKYPENALKFINIFVPLRIAHAMNNNLKLEMNLTNRERN